MFLEVMYHTRTTFTGRFERDSELYTDPRRRSSLLFSYLCTVKVLFFLQDIYETHHLNVIYLFWHDILTLLLLWINFDTQDWRFHFYFSNITTWWSFKVPLKLQLKVTLPFIVIETLKKKKIRFTTHSLGFLPTYYIQVRLRDEKPMLIINLFHDQ